LLLFCILDHHSPKERKTSSAAQKMGKLTTFLTTDQISETNAIPFYGMLLTFPPRFVGNL